MTGIPLLDLKEQYASIREEIRVAVDRVMDDQHFILGPEVEALESEIATYSQCRYGVGVSSGTDALLMALMAIDLKPGDEVITTPYTFFATVGAIARLKAKPIFVDIDPWSFNIDPIAIEAVITPQTKAIIPVHLYGQMADMDPIIAIAKHHNLYIIEDAAQAIGAEYKGQRAGAMGSMGCFSFFPSKNLGAFGDAGMVTTNDPALAEQLQLLRNHGYKPKYYNRVIGGNFRLDAIQAAVLRVKLKYLDDWTTKRQHNATTYRQLFELSGHAFPAESQIDNGIALPVELPDRRHIYNQFVIRSPQRDSIMMYLKQHQIGSEIYYPLPMHLQECFAELGYHTGEFPVSERAAKETLALPIYPELTEDMVTYVVNTVSNFYTN